jgi:hypothetical protein
VFGKFQAYFAGDFQKQVDTNNDDVQSQYRTIPTFLTLFIFGFLYELVVVWDALRMKNTIQVIGVCIANLALLVYTAIQIEQIQVAIDTLQRFTPNSIPHEDVWSGVKAYLMAIPCIIGFCTIGMVYIAFKLYQEFAWDILKNIGADYRMKKRFLHYQVRFHSQGGDDPQITKC